MSSLVTDAQPETPETPENQPRLVYWKINARATPALFVAALAGIPITWDHMTAKTWPTPKPQMPFGQLPVLYHNGAIIAESMTIARYLGRMGGIDSYHTGDAATDLTSFGISDMLIERAADLFHDMISNKYIEKSYAGYITFFTDAGVESGLITHLRYLETLLGDRLFFAGDAPLQGDAVLFAFLYIVRCCSDTRTDEAMSGFPKLVAWKERFEQIPGIVKALADLKPIESYFLFPNVDLD